jgi:hypothetical protein
LFIYSASDSTLLAINFSQLSDSLEIDTVRYAYNILGGAANKIPVQFNADSTIFIDAPSGNSFLAYLSSAFSWQSFPVTIGLGGTNNNAFTSGRILYYNGTAIASTTKSISDLANAIHTHTSSDITDFDAVVNALIDAYVTANSATIEYKDWSSANQAINVVEGN